jgi:hypothetical protein
MSDPKDAGVSLPGGVPLEDEAPAPAPPSIPEMRVSQNKRNHLSRCRLS